MNTTTKKQPKPSTAPFRQTTSRHHQAYPVRTVRRNNNVITEINAETKIATFNATIDDLLFSASTAEKALGILKKNKP